MLFPVKIVRDGPRIFSVEEKDSRVLLKNKGQAFGRRYRVDRWRMNI